jgi:signal transduction histidine kinase
MLVDSTPRHTILVVDDEEAILTAVQRLLRRDYHVLTASSVDTAFALLRAQPVHLVMSDLRMPDMSGVEFLTFVKEGYPNCVRILFTGYTDTNSAIDAINSGSVYCYIPKPWDPDELRLLIAQAAERYELGRERRMLLSQLRETNEVLERRNVELEAANSKLRDLDRLKTVFMELTSHELNTPIAILQGYTFLLGRELGEQHPRHIQALRQSTARLQNITQKMFAALEGNRVEATLELAPTSLREVLEGVRTTVVPFLVKRNQTLEIECAAEMEVELDAAKISDAVLHLVINAIKFSADGQVVRVGCEVAETGEVLIHVADDGIGISDDDLLGIFDPFFGTFDSQHHSSGDFGYQKRGIGLGLAIVRNFAELHGGTVEVETKLGEGSTFTIRLPRRLRSN